MGAYAHSVAVLPSGCAFVVSRQSHRTGRNRQGETAESPPTGGIFGGLGLQPLIGNEATATSVRYSPKNTLALPIAAHASSALTLMSPLGALSNAISNECIAFWAIRRAFLDQ